MLALAVVLLLAAGVSRAPAASADVCTGGYPYAAPGSPPSSLLAAVPLLEGPRWSKETLPQWSGTLVLSAWANQLAYAWFNHDLLWEANGTFSWWVIPGQGCTLGPSGEAYDPEDCVMVAAQLELVSFDCVDPQRLAVPSLPVAIVHGGALLVSGFAPPGTGSVEVAFGSGNAIFAAVGGVYGGVVSASVGKVQQVTNLPAINTRPLASVVLVDQTGLFSGSQGPLASTPRLRGVAARLHASIHSVTAAILGTAVAGHRARDQVLYGHGARTLAVGVARALHATAPAPYTGGAAQMFGATARVVVLVGRSD